MLARLEDPNQGQTLKPHQFLPQIDKHKWYVLFSQKMLERTILLLENWPTKLPAVPLSVNLAGPELLDDLFYEKLLRRYMEAIAEGVETKAQLALLLQMGFTRFQGFYFGKPAPMEHWIVRANRNSDINRPPRRMTR